MVIKSLRLDNFQGIRSLSLDLDGKSATIFGANEAGKTTIFNAITWLLFGQASTGVSNFTPKTIDDSGEVHHLDHSVTAVFICDDGAELTLMRLYHEVYTKKRGSATDIFSGHTTEYFIDGVPVAEKNYADTLLRMFGSVETMRLLTMPDYFPNRYEWKNRRQLLLQICGDITDADVFETFSSELHDLPAILKKPGATEQLYTVDEYRAIAQRSMADINRDLQNIPARIDEASKAKPILDGTASYDDCKANSEWLRQKIFELEGSSRNATADGMREKAVQALLAAKNKLAEAKQQHEDGTRRAKSAAQARIDTAVDAVSLLKRTIRFQTSDRDDILRRIQDMEIRRDQLAREYETVSARTYSGNDKCPACGQNLPEAALQETIAKFNAAKSIELEGINLRGKTTCAIGMINDAREELTRVDAQMRTAQSNLEEAEAELARANAAKPSTMPFEQLPVYERLSADVAELEKQLSNADAIVAKFTNDAADEIEAAKIELDRAMSNMLKFRQIEQQNARINELETQEKALAEKYENFEHGVTLCDSFVRNKVSLLTDRINRQFDHVRFILFSEQINGGLKECCEVAVPASDGSLIPYAFSNTAARLNAGLEIIGVLSRFYHASLPVVVDNAESVTEIDSRGISQLIRLVVSPSDKTLRMELDSNSSTEVA